MVPCCLWSAATIHVEHQQGHKEGKKNRESNTEIFQSSRIFCFVCGYFGTP